MRTPAWPALLALTLALDWFLPHASARQLERVYTHEHPAFQCATARLVVGRDGMVYLSSGWDIGLVLRLNRNGKDKTEGQVVYAIANATANAAGVVATANIHLARTVNLYDPSFNRQGSVAEFLSNDQLGFLAPAHVEAGASGDFYAVDQNRDRIVRLSATGRVVGVYLLPREPKDHKGLILDFRVCEALKAFYVLPAAGPLRCVGFDGKTRWTCDARVMMTEMQPLIAGGFDVDDHGTLYTIEPRGTTVRKFSPAGKAEGEIRLLAGKQDVATEKYTITDLRVAGDDLLLKRKHEAELFQVYDRTTGALRRAVFTDHEHLTVTFPDDGPWTAGTVIPLAVRLTVNQRDVAPRWRAWACTQGCADYREFALRDGKLSVPADCAGIFQITITPEVQPRQMGDDPLPRLQFWVEVRQPNTRGTLSVWTDAGRTHFGRGEDIPFSLLLRTTTGAPTPVTVRLLDGKRTLAEVRLTLSPGAQPRLLVLPASLTAGLLPGEYRLDATASGFSGLPQQLVIGPGMSRSGFHFLQYGDYSPLYPATYAGDAAWRAVAHVSRTRKLGFNLLVDRLGNPIQMGHLAVDLPPDLAALQQRLTTDPLAAAPQKILTASALKQSWAGYSAMGIEQMAILMLNDAGLPLGTAHDPRSPEQLLDAITQVTQAARSYPAFRGWSWSSNWWVGRHSADAARTPEERAAYETALKRARETGAWDPVLDRVSGYWLAYAVEAQDRFNKRLKELAPGLVTASAAPYRHAFAYPPVSLANVDESDLQAQWEQIAVPYHTPHNVDYYRRPGRRAWVHPEIWNDAGTGEQILPTLFQALMRGAEGVGCSGAIPPWGTQPDDPRSSYRGTASVYRALGELLRQYGPWLATLRNNDRVAIVVSGREMKLDRWTSTYGIHFARLFEAYTSCLHAHRPASFVFAEDLKPDSLSAFRAVLVVGQTVEMEPALAEALSRARAAGVAVFHDGTCRPEVVRELRPLGLAFNQFEKDPRPDHDDIAYSRFFHYCQANKPILARALAPAAAPPARVDNANLLLSERRGEEGRYLFVVNDTPTGLDPGQLWRVTMAAAALVPVQASVRLNEEAKAVYDVFALRQVTPREGAVVADCRDLPARIFALLPEPIAQVELRAPEAVKAGQAFRWAVQIQDEKGRTIRASVPVRLRLLGGDERVVEEHFIAADSRGASGTLTAGLNVLLENWTIEATELLSGKTARSRLTVAAGSKDPLPISEAPAKAGPPLPVVEPAARDVGKEAARGLVPAETRFGPHVRDMTLTANGTLAVLNTMNWDHNLYALDVATGQVRWRQRVGDYFAFAPQVQSQGVAVQGFDFRSAEGYHLYRLDPDGKLEQRFALYGLPRRATHWFVPGILNDRINNFATPEDGGWAASAGDLGLAVWSRQGKMLWAQDWTANRHTATLAALNAETLAVVEGVTVTAYEAVTGKRSWQVALPAVGEARLFRVSADGQTCALSTTGSGGRVCILRRGAVVKVIHAVADNLALSADGTMVALTAGHQLSLYSVESGLRWTLPGDSPLSFPRFAPDNKRIVATSEMGTVYVLDLEGNLLLNRDQGALTVPAWLPGGDLLLANWMGTVCRLDARYAERWRILLRPEAVDMRGKLLSTQAVPTARITSWVNAETSPAALTPNLLAPDNVIVRFDAGRPDLTFAQPPAALVDGKSTPPSTPWVEWRAIGQLGQGSAAIVIDTFRTQLRVTSLTLVEDPDHPESWVRDAVLEYWDAARSVWVRSLALRSDSAVHTHRLPRPVETSRLRIVLPGGRVGNLRLGEIVLHGERLGSSHPDVIARRPLAVLFDEGDELKNTLVLGSNGVEFRFEGAYAGNRCLALRANTSVGPVYQPPFVHDLPDWDFEIAENPQPGQYRYVQFAWRALAPETKGMTLRLGSAGFHAGTFTPFELCQPVKVADTPPGKWETVRVDMWKVFKAPTRIRTMFLSSLGGPAAMDQILLGRSPEDFPANKK